MNIRSVGLFVAILTILVACDTTNPDDLSEEEAIANYYAQHPNAPVTGDRVTTTEIAPIYDPLGVEVGKQQAGALGLVLNGPKLKNGGAWFRVDFEAGADGLISEDMLMNDEGIEDEPGSGALTLGWLGCSMTRDLGQGMADNKVHESWQNYDSEGEKVLKSYSGGVLTSWGAQGEGGYSLKWSAFERGLGSWPGTDLIIWQICTGESDITSSPEARLDELVHVAEMLQEKAPGIPVYIVNQPSYNGVECHITGEDGVAYSQSLVDLAVSEGLALGAPALTLGPLNEDEVKDGCHVNSYGQDRLVAQTLEWLATL